MRIAVTTWNRRRIGGAETYIAGVLPDLVAAGHQVALWSECDEEKSLRPPIAIPEGGVEWCAETMGVDRSFEALRSWRPDVVFAHGVADVNLEPRLVSIAPAVMLMHNYHATCVSGTKSFCLPVHRPCARRFGVACLALYLPRRCGGLNPLSMIGSYDLIRRRLDALHHYAEILTLSGHMRDELLRHGFAPEHVHAVPHLFVEPSEQPPEPSALFETPPRWELIFAGRFANNKGGDLLLDALPATRDRLARPLRLTFAGDGPEREAWTRAATRAERARDGIEVDFVGWLPGDALRRRFAASHLNVVPSVWPEPLGLVGIEASQDGVPSVAFDVGGVREWLRPGISGELAPGDPPTTDGLATAICTALGESTRYARLRTGARWVASRWDRPKHVGRVLDLLARAVK
jgi:glycosyltransferase involved in cell wall biosynthesis